MRCDSMPFCPVVFSRQAIEVLERATRVKPVAPLFVLLGKTNMKAKKFLDAITSFNTAIQILVGELYVKSE